VFDEIKETATVQLPELELAGRPLKLQLRVQAPHAATDTTKPATIQKLTDQSSYTVRFADGDERTLRRSAVMPMGPSHFEEGSSLGDFPLTDPDTFGQSAKLDSGRKRRRISDGRLPLPASGGEAVLAAMRCC
jgi:hypothetical protein